MTKAEIILWVHLRDLRTIGYNFRRQHPIGPYVADFTIYMGQSIVEVDGETHGTEEEIEHDQRRDAYLKSKGWRVLRIPNMAIYENLDHALEVIISHLPPSASLSRHQIPRCVDRDEQLA